MYEGIFSKQTFNDMYSEIQVDISYFNKITKQFKYATCQNAEKLQSS